MRWFGRRVSGLPFADRQEAGERLATLLASVLGLVAGAVPAGRAGQSGPGGEAVQPAEALPGREAAPAGVAAGTVSAEPGPIVLGIPRGGVPVAAVVASLLGLPLDVIVAHKLGAPGQRELAVGAVAADGTVVIEPWANEIVGDEAWVRASAEAEVARVRAHEAILRGGHPAPDLRGRAVVVVDDGIATGATIRAAAMAARAAGASRVIVASPVGAAESVAALRAVADDVVVVATPEPFYAVGEFYDRFDQVDDGEVAALLERAGSGG